MRASLRKEIQRLLSLETGTIVKAYGDVRVALVYPNSYHLGMSNLGFQTVYALINKNPVGHCERSFLFEGDEAVTLESGATLSSFDVVGFSVSFELDYPNIPEILRRAKIPPRAADRDDRHPLIVAGGAAVMLNPEPIADFVDGFVIGEAETVLDGVLSIVAAGKGKGKPFVRERLAQLEGVYVPSLYEVEVNGEGRVREVKVSGDAPYPIRKNPPPDIEEFATTSEALTPETIFADRLLVEVSRGCPRRCKFCGARSIYCPPRWRSGGVVLDAINSRMCGGKRVGLMGAAIGDHREIQEICSSLADEGVDISISSVRVDRVTPALASALARGGARTLTIAPEGGSEKRRREVGKELSNGELIECARILKESGIQALKVYFMVGFPHEERDDVEQIVERAAELSAIIRVTVSVSPFVPKPRTPYQRFGSKPLGYLRSTLSYLQKELRKLRGVTFSAVSPKDSLMEAALSRGSRSLSNWLETNSAPPAEVEKLACREIPDEEMLPWDIFEDAGKS